MSGQDRGLIGRLVGGMIRRSVRRRFHTVYWTPPVQPLPAPSILVANHHGWFDGYLMYHAATRLGLPVVDWIQEFDAFPLFRFVGGLPFPQGDPARRAGSLKRTVRLMKEGVSLVLFAEGVLHYPPDLLPFGESLAWLCRQVPEAHIVPVGIVYETAMHERPEAFIRFGAPFAAGPEAAEAARAKLEDTLAETRSLIRDGKGAFEILATGTKDVNERWDMRRRGR